MTIELDCQSCGKSYRLGDQLAGKKVKCKECGTTIKVPAAAADDDDDYLNSLVAAESSAAAGDDDDDYEETPRRPARTAKAKVKPEPKKKKKKSSSSRASWTPSIGFNLNRINAALVVGGFMLGFMGVQEMRLAAAAKAEPQRITCADLSARGPGDNAHVELTNFILCTQSYVYEGRAANSPWDKVWVPAVPVGGAFHQQVMQLLATQPNFAGPMPVPSDIKVLVKSTRTRNDMEMTTLSNRPSLRGVVVNKIESLGKDELKLLQQSYPGTNFSSCYIMHEGRALGNASMNLAYFGGAAVLVLLGGIWILAGSSD